jgi:hypothetical protein
MSFATVTRPCSVAAVSSKGKWALMAQMSHWSQLDGAMPDKMVALLHLRHARPPRSCRAAHCQPPHPPLHLHPVPSAAGQRAQAFRAAALRRPLAAAPRRAAVAAQAMMYEWTDPEFAAMTLEAFPDKAIATAEEARVRWARWGTRRSCIV